MSDKLIEASEVLLKEGKITHQKIASVVKRWIDIEDRGNQESSRIQSRQEIHELP